MKAITDDILAGIVLDRTEHDPDANEVLVADREESDEEPLERVQTDTTLTDEGEISTANANQHEADKSVANLSDPLRGYLQDIGRRKLLTAQQEIELGQRMDEGRTASGRLESGESLTAKERKALHGTAQDGERARELMTESNLRLVVSIAKRWQGRGLPLFDLIQEGNIGLIKAVERFDYRRGFRFSTYATWWIRQSIARGVSEQGHTIRLPVHIGEMSSRVERAGHRLLQKLGRDATVDELAAETVLPTAKVEQIIKLWQQPASIDAPIGEDGATLGDFVAEEDAQTPVDIVSQSMLRERMASVLGSLSARERLVLELRYGIRDGKEYTLREAGEVMGITRERVRQIQATAMRHLRYVRYREKLDGYIED